MLGNPHKVAAGHPQVVRLRGLGVWLIGVGALIAFALGLHRLARPLSADDLALVRTLAGDRTSPLTTAAHALSTLGRSWVLVAVAAIAVAVVRRSPARWWPPISLAAAIVVQNAVKAIVQRPRPPVVHLEHVTSSSFPSGHATETTGLCIAIGLAVCASTARRPAKLAALATLAVISTAVACARVYLGVHYPSDVIGGGLLGAGCGVVSVLSTYRGSSRASQAARMRAGSPDLTGPEDERNLT